MTNFLAMDGGIYIACTVRQLSETMESVIIVGFTIASSCRTMIGCNK
jgi:hypothetical protein